MGTPDDAGQDKRRIAVANERVKLRANALDRMSTACFAIGVLGPTMGVLYGTTMNVGPHGLFLVAGHLIWLCTAAALHPMALRALRRLR